MQICTRLWWRNAMLEVTVPDRRDSLPTPACVIVAVRLSIALEDAHSKGPSNLHVRAARTKNLTLKLLVKKIYHLNILQLYPAQTRERKERVTEFLNQAVDLLTSDCSISTENEGLVQVSHYNQSRLWSILYTTLAQITRNTPSEHTLKLNTLYWKCFHRSGFLSYLRLPWNFLLYWIYFFHSGLLSNLRLPWQTEFARNTFKRIYIFYHSGFLSNLRLPWNFSLYRNIFYHWRYLSNLRLP